MGKKKIDLVDKHVGMRLRIIRNNANKTAAELAKELKVSIATLDDMEGGAIRITPSQMIQIMEIFATSASFFFIGIEDGLNQK